MEATFTPPAPGEHTQTVSVETGDVDGPGEGGGPLALTGSGVVAGPVIQYSIGVVVDLTPAGTPSATGTVGADIDGIEIDGMVASLEGLLFGYGDCSGANDAAAIQVIEGTCAPGTFVSLGGDDALGGPGGQLAFTLGKPFSSGAQITVHACTAEPGDRFLVGLLTPGSFESVECLSEASGTATCVAP